MIKTGMIGKQGYDCPCRHNPDSCPCIIERETYIFDDEVERIIKDNEPDIRRREHALRD